MRRLRNRGRVIHKEKASIHSFKTQKCLSKILFISNPISHSVTFSNYNCLQTQIKNISNVYRTKQRRQVMISLCACTKFKKAQVVHAQCDSSSTFSFTTDLETLLFTGIFEAYSDCFLFWIPSFPDDNRPERSSFYVINKLASKKEKHDLKR